MIPPCFTAESPRSPYANADYTACLSGPAAGRSAGCSRSTPIDSGLGAEKGALYKRIGARRVTNKPAAVEEAEGASTKTGSSWVRDVGRSRARTPLEGRHEWSHDVGELEDERVAPVREGRRRGAPASDSPVRAVPAGRTRAAPSTTRRDGTRPTPRSRIARSSNQ